MDDEPRRAFFVQKHAARRLHFDFRLELGGALASWAVPRGPSLDPDDKRLAVKVDDHALEYGPFEGTIAGGYGAGAVMLWDRGWWRPEGGAAAEASLAVGRLRFELFGERMRGGWMLLRMRTKDKGDNWLLHKLDDAEARVPDDLTIRYPTSVASGRTMAEIAAAGAPPT